MGAVSGHLDLELVLDPLRDCGEVVGGQQMHVREACAPELPQVSHSRAVSLRKCAVLASQRRPDCVVVRTAETGIIIWPWYDCE